MENPTQYIQIRTKKIGLLIYDARISKGISLEEIAKLTGIPANRLSDFEKGSQSPSLPEMEIIAYTFDLPIEHFWGKKSLSEKSNGDQQQKFQQLIALRQRVIGANIKKLRTEQDFTEERIAGSISIPIEILRQYELGEIEIPVPHLELIAKRLNCQIEDFYDQKGIIGEWRKKQIEYQKIQDLPKELREFVSKPINSPYIELAVRLSELDVNKLRTVAEGLLEITL